MEKVHSQWLKTLAYLFCLFLLRVVVENSFFPIKIDRFVLTHEISFFFASFFLTVFLFCILIREDLQKLFSTAAVVMSLVIVAPLLDKFLFHRVNPYDYTRPQDFWLNFKTFFWFSSSVGMGLIIELGLIILLITGYVLYKTRSWWKGLCAAAASYFGIHLLAAPGIYLNLPDYIGAAKFLPQNMYGERLLYCLFYLWASLFVVFVIMMIKKPKQALALVKNTRPIRTASFLILAMAGMALSHQLSFIFPETIYLLAVVFSVFLLWQSAVIVNDVYDVETDRINRKQRPLVIGVISSTDYLQLGIFIGCLGVIVSFLLGPISFFCGLAFFLLGLSYSIPPFQFRKNLLSYPVIGLGQSLTFMMGFAAGEFSLHVVDFNQGFKFALYIFGIITLGSVIKDGADYAGDSSVKIKNFFVLLGWEKGIMYASILLFIVFLSPLLFIHALLDFSFYVPMAFIAGLIYLKKMNYQLVVFIYILAAIFFMVRYI